MATHKITLDKIPGDEWAFPVDLQPRKCEETDTWVWNPPNAQYASILGRVIPEVRWTKEDLDVRDALMVRFAPYRPFDMITFIERSNPTNAISRFVGKTVLRETDGVLEWVVVLGREPSVVGVDPGQGDSYSVTVPVNLETQKFLKPPQSWTEVDSEERPKSQTDEGMGNAIDGIFPNEQTQIEAFVIDQPVVVNCPWCEADIMPQPESISASFLLKCQSCGGVCHVVREIKATFTAFKAESI